jgi:hypothetical protein
MEKQRKKKKLNFDKNILLRVSADEHKKISNYAKKNNTAISKLLRDFINSLES